MAHSRETFTFTFIVISMSPERQSAPLCSSTPAEGGWNEEGGGERIEGTVTSPTEGEIKERVTYFYLSFVQRKTLSCLVSAGSVLITQELRDGPCSVVMRVLFVQGDSPTRGPKLLSIKNYVIDIERRPFSASIMSRSCFPSFPVCVYKFSSHYINNIIFIDNSLGPVARESHCIRTRYLLLQVCK